MKQKKYKQTNKQTKKTVFQSFNLLLVIHTFK